MTHTPPVRHIPKTEVDPFVRFIALIIVGALLVFMLGAVLYAHFEAQAYNRVTGKQVSTWDALFLDLRVTEPAK